MKTLARLRGKLTQVGSRGLVVVAALMGLLGVATPALASHSGKTVVLAQGQTINHDYFTAGSVVEVDGTVNGDVYVAGGQVTINGTVNGDVLAAGGTITVDGTVNGNVRAAGGSIVIDGRIVKNASVAGGSVQLTHNASVGGSVAVAGGSLQDSGTISGDVNAATGQLTVGSDARVGGSLVYWSRQQATISNGSVAGTITHRTPPVEHHRSSGFAGALLASLYWLVVAYVLAVLLLWWLPRQSETVTRTIREHPWQSLGWGVVVAIATPIIGIVLMITVIGIPLALILWAIYAIAVLLAPVWVIMSLRELFTARIAKQLNVFVALLIVVFVYMLITLIPVVGSLLIIVSGLIGLGAAATAGRSNYLSLRRKNEI